MDRTISMHLKGKKNDPRRVELRKNIGNQSYLSIFEQCLSKSCAISKHQKPALDFKSYRTKFPMSQIVEKFTTRLKNILKLLLESMTVCFGSHQIKFNKPSNESLSKTDLTKTLKINEIESDEEKDSDEDDDGESGSGSDSGGMIAKIAIKVCILKTFIFQ